MTPGADLEVWVGGLTICWPKVSTYMYVRRRRAAAGSGVPLQMFLKFRCSEMRFQVNPVQFWRKMILSCYVRHVEVWQLAELFWDRRLRKIAYIEYSERIYLIFVTSLLNILMVASRAVGPDPRLRCSLNNPLRSHDCHPHLTGKFHMYVLGSGWPNLLAFPIF
jgi:hypothetical protein